MDPFALVILGGLAALILWIWLLGKYYPGNGLEQLGLKKGDQVTVVIKSTEVMLQKN